MARQSGVGRTTGQKIVKDLGLRSRARERRHKLQPQDKINRQLKCEIILAHQLRPGRERLLIFEDEAKFELQPYVNSRMDRVIERRSGDAGDVAVNMRAKSQGIMVAGFWMSDGKKYLHVFNANESVCNESYRLVLDEFFLWLVVTYTQDELRDCLFIHDNAPCHTAIATQEYLGQCTDAVDGDFLKSGEWPSHSPDLNPLDFACWDTLKREVCGRDGHKSLLALKVAIRSKWRNLFPPNKVRDFCAKFRPRLERCVQVHGDYIENKRHAR